MSARLNQDSKLLAHRSDFLYILLCTFTFVWWFDERPTHRFLPGRNSLFLCVLFKMLQRWERLYNNIMDRCCWTATADIYIYFVVCAISLSGKCVFNNTRPNNIHIVIHFHHLPISMYTQIQQENWIYILYTAIQNYIDFHRSMTEFSLFIYFYLLIYKRKCTK
jgi:hypothetical protein